MGNIAKLVENFCDENGYRFYRDYSGRFMYGKRCIGFVVDGGFADALVRLVDYLRDNDIDSASEALGNVAHDSLGFDTIIYFPYIEGR